MGWYREGGDFISSLVMGRYISSIQTLNTAQYGTKTSVLTIESVLYIERLNTALKY